MRIFIWNYNFVGFSKKFVSVVNFELVYSLREVGDPPGVYFT